MQVAGYHQSIYACTLPHWLSDEVLQKMVEHFGDILRDILRALMLGCCQTRNRMSGDSAGFSPSSSKEDVSELLGVVDNYKITDDEYDIDDKDAASDSDAEPVSESDSEEPESDSEDLGAEE